MTALKSGWVIVGSTPSTDGTTRTKGNGCLLVLNANGQLSTVWAGPTINGPWGNMATVDNGSTATLFISMAGFDVPGPEVHDATGSSVIVNKATVLRLQLSIPPGQPPAITNQTVVANGFGQRADKDVFLIGPTGLALGSDNTLYVSDALGNQIVAIPEATTRTSSAGTGRVVTKDGLLKRPLALAMTADGHLLTCNGLNGQVVEIDPATGRQLYAQWIDANQAQSPPGSGDLFGLAMSPDGKSFYYVEDDMNTLVEGDAVSRGNSEGLRPTRRGLVRAAAGLAAAPDRVSALAVSPRRWSRQRAGPPPEMTPRVRSSRSGASTRAGSRRRCRVTPMLLHSIFRRPSATI